MRLNTKDWGKGKKIAATLTVVCIGVFIIALIGSALSPDANTSTSNTLKPNATIEDGVWDMSGIEYGTTPTDLDIYGDCLTKNGTGDHYYFHAKEMQLLAYYSNNTFNYSKVPITYHVDPEYPDYKIVDHVFFENGTEMTDPGDLNSTIDIAVYGKFTKINNPHMSEYFGMDDDEVANSP